MSVVISAISQISAMGQGAQALGKRPTLVEIEVATRRGPYKLKTYAAPETELPAILPDSVKRRLPRISKMALSVVGEALHEAFGHELEFLKQNPTRVGMAVGTAFGSLEMASRFERRVVMEGPTGASPTLFAGSVQNAMASNLSIVFGIQGPVSTITTMEHTTFGTLRTAFDWIERGMVDHAVVCIGDELSEFHAYAFADRGYASEQLLPRRDERTAILGEGMVAFVLSREDRAAKCHATIAELNLFCVRPPEVDRLSLAAYGNRGQWNQYLEWLGPFAGSLHCSAELYGSMITGAGFELAFAAQALKTLGASHGCVQLTNYGEAQSIVLV